MSLFGGWVGVIPFSSSSDQRPIRRLLSRPISMLKTIHALRVDYGPNIEGFYKKVLGLDDGDLAKLREEMLEDANEITKPQ